MNNSAEPQQEPRQRSTALAVGAVSLLASALFRQGIGLVSLGVTARLLTPTDFGIVAYFLFFTTLFEVLQRQVSMALIRLETVTQEHLHTVFTIQFLLGVMGSILFWFFEPVLVFFGLADLVPILPAISAYSLLIGMRNPKLTIYERDLKFSYSVKEETLSRVSYSIAAIFLAWMWPTFWSLIIAGFIAASIHGAYTYIAAPMKPRLTLVKWRDSLVFSLWAMAAQFSQVFANKIPLLFIGANLGLAEAGLFRLGNRITGIVTVQFFAPVQRVIYPGLADMSRSAGQQKDAFIRMNAMLLAIVLPLGIGTALIAEDAVVYVLGEKWRTAALVIWVLAPLKALETLQSNVNAAIFVDGSVRRLFMRNVMLLVLSTSLMTYGVQFGFTGALITAALCSVVALVITLFLGRKFGNGGFFDPLTVGWRSFLSCIVMALVVVTTGIVLHSNWPGIHPLILILSKVVIGIVTYVLIHILLWAMSGRPVGFETQLFSLVGRLRNHMKRGKKRA